MESFVASVHLRSYIDTFHVVENPSSQQEQVSLIKDRITTPLSPSGMRMLCALPAQEVVLIESPVV